MKRETVIYIYIGFLLEASCFILAGAVAEILIGINRWIFYWVFIIIGVITAYFVGKLIEENSIEKYKRGLKCKSQ